MTNENEHNESEQNKEIENETRMEEENQQESINEEQINVEETEKEEKQEEKEEEEEKEEVIDEEEEKKEDNEEQQENEEQEEEEKEAQQQMQVTTMETKKGENECTTTTTQEQPEKEEIKKMTPMTPTEEAEAHIKEQLKIDLNGLLSEMPKLQLSWKDLEYKVKVPDPKVKFPLFKLFKKVNKSILHPMNGYVNPGEVLAIMGPSGAGKTSLLNILAQRVKRFQGSVMVNGKNIGSKFRRVAAFVQQDDILMGNLTVKETLNYAAQLRLPTSMSRKEKNAIVNSVIAELGLDHAVNTRIGVPGISKGLSGGEKKRCSIAVELLVNPSIIFLDEPTSGLDARTAMNIVETIVALARRGRTIVLTIHQPRSNIFHMFDKLLLLARGKVAYFGKANEAVTYFKQIESAYDIPKNYNPADYFIDLITPNSRDTLEGKQQKQLDNQRIDDILDFFEREHHPVEIPVYEEEKTLSRKLGKYPTNWFWQLGVLIIRAFINIIRDRTLTLARLFQTLSMSLLVGLIFFRLDTDQTGMGDRTGALFFVMVSQVMSSVFSNVSSMDQEIGVFIRERGSKTYHTSAYFISKWIADIPNQVIFPLIFGSISYWIVGLNGDFVRFLVFLLVLVVVGNAALALGGLISSFAPNGNVAIALTPVLLTTLMLFGGFYVNKESVQPWLIWLLYSSLFFYGFESLIINEMNGATFYCTDDQKIATGPTTSICPVTSGDQVLDSLKFNKEYYWIWINLGILIGITLILRFISYWGLRCTKKPRR